MPSPTISCIVPTFNSEKYLKSALESIFAQTYRPIEVIVADDHSTDNTAAITRLHNSNINFVSQKLDSPAGTRNLGLDTATGDFLAFLDPDDLWHPEKLARQMARFQIRPELEISVTYAQMFWEDTVMKEGLIYQDLPRSGAVPGYATTTLLARKDVFLKIGRFNTKYFFGDATDWFIRAREVDAVIELLEDVLTFHRMHESNLTRRRKTDSREEFLEIVKARLDRQRSKKGPLEDG